MTNLILASSSSYRRQLLDKLKLNYLCQPPNIDESALPNEDPNNLVLRLAITKAKAIDTPESLIIGSDQVASFDNCIIGKPGNKQRAQQQLELFSGQSVTFHTGLCLHNTNSGLSQSTVELYRVEFNTLSESQIDAYLEQEQPYDCAGSFKSEGLGISLFRKLQGDDPNTLVGLPLIKLCEFLRSENHDPLNLLTRKT